MRSNCRGDVYYKTLVIELFGVKPAEVRPRKKTACKFTIDNA